MHTIEGTEPMAKKKAKLGRPPKAEGAREARLSVRAREEWIAWLNALAHDQRLDVATLVDHALAAYAKAKGFRQPPDR